MTQVQPGPSDDSAGSSTLEQTGQRDQTTMQSSPKIPQQQVIAQANKMAQETKPASSSSTQLSPIVPSSAAVNALAAQNPMFLYQPALGHLPYAGSTAMRMSVLQHQNPKRSGKEKSRHTPPIFKNRKLRSGKWIPEEEIYGKHLIRAFENGQLSDCENGTTLRAYLSQKLHCAPMRISKKFARKGIGKMVYSSKLNVAIVLPLTGDFAATEKLMKESEQAFYAAIFPSNGLFPLDQYVSPCPVPAGALTLVPTALPIIPAPLLPASAPILPSIHKPPPVSGAVQEKVLLPASLSSSGAVLCPTPGSSSANSSRHTQQLHQSFVNALTQIKPAGQASHPAPAVAPNHVLSIASRGIAKAGGIRHTIVPQAQLAPKPPPQDSLPDFLTDFERVALTLNPDLATTEALDRNKDVSRPLPSSRSPEDLQYSPPFTSRSFDDFHRFLGKDLTPLDDTTEKPHTINSKETAALAPSPAVSSIAVTKDTTSHPMLAVFEEPTSALYTAESYAMLAVESATHASRHAAYSSEYATPILPNPLQVGEAKAFDAAGVLNLVSKHVEISPEDGGDRGASELPENDISPDVTPNATASLMIGRESMAHYGPSHSSVFVSSGSEPNTESEGLSSNRGSSTGGSNGSECSLEEGEAGTVLSGRTAFSHDDIDSDDGSHYDDDDDDDMSCTDDDDDEVAHSSGRKRTWSATGTSADQKKASSSTKKIQKEKTRVDWEAPA